MPLCFFSCTPSWTKRQDVPWRRKGWQKCIREGNNAGQDHGYADYSMECNLNCANVIIALVGFITVTVNNSTHISCVSNHFSTVTSWFTTKFCGCIMLTKHCKSTLRTKLKLYASLINELIITRQEHFFVVYISERWIFSSSILSLFLL